jgi:hypothetical protein
MLAALSGANDAQTTHISQDRDAANTELTQVQAQEKAEQALIANSHQTVNAMRPSDFPVPGRKTIPPSWKYQTTAQATPEALAAITKKVKNRLEREKAKADMLVPLLVNRDSS